MGRRLNRREKFQRHRRKKQIQLSFVILWGLFLSINIFTENLGQFLMSRSIRFKWISNPDFSSFFNLYDLTTIHHGWVWVKLGHFIGFAILNLLLYSWIRSHRIAIIIAVAFAVSTELLQLFFGRDGRFYDIVIDSLGVLLDYYLLKKPSSFKSSIERVIR